MRTSSVLAAIAALSLAAGAAHAQTLYITGTITEAEWSPGATGWAGSPATGQDAYDETIMPTDPDTLNSVNVSAAYLDLDSLFEGNPIQHLWKLAAPGWDPEVPGPDNMWFYYEDGTDVTFYYQTGSVNDGFFPFENFLYTSASLYTIETASRLEIVGSFNDQLGGTNWAADEDNPVLTDAGSGEVGDGLWGLEVTGLDPGGYEFKIAIDPDLADEWWHRTVSAFGLSWGGPNLSFTVVESSDVITILLDGATGRSSVTNDNPTLQPGPPFYATGPWGTALDSTTIMTEYDDGTYRGVYTVPTAGNHGARVRQGVGRWFADSGDYPFTTTVEDQDVLVIFDRNTYTDDYHPAADFIVVIDPDDRSGLNTFTKVQPVGNWQEDFGASEWSNDVPAMYMSQVGDFWQITLNELDGNSTTGAFVKAVGARDGVAEDSTNAWNIQFGGPIDGLTVGGNNDSFTFDVAANQPHTFKVDPITGRMNAAEGSSLPDPVRGNYLDAQADTAEPVVTTSVQNWHLY